MDEINIISVVREFSFWAIFAYLYLRERQRARELSDERVADLKRWIDTLTAIQVTQHGRVTIWHDEQGLRRGDGD